MSPFYTGLLIGFFLGGFFGVVMLCTLMISREGDARYDQLDRRDLHRSPVHRVYPALVDRAPVGALRERDVHDAKYHS